jgi:hypothetical protein
MRPRVLLCLGLLGLTVAACLSSAQEPKAGAGDAKAGPAANLVPSTFRGLLVTDGRFPPVKGSDGKDQLDPRTRQGKIHCLVCEYGLAPVIAIFVRADPSTLPGDKGVAELIKRVNDQIPKHRSDKLAAFVMFLRVEGGTKEVAVKVKQEDGSEVETQVKTDREFPDEEPLEKREKTVKAIQDFAAAVNAPYVPMGLAADKSKAVTDWKLDEKNEVTVVVYDRMHLVGSPFTFEKASDVTNEKIDEILKAAIGSFTEVPEAKKK